MRRKKKRLWKPIVLGFAALYLAVMGLATWLMGLKFRDEFRDNMFLEQSAFHRWVESYDDNYPGQEEDFPEGRAGYYTHLAAGIPDSMDDRFQQFSGAVYGPDGKLLARTEEVIGGGTASAETNWQTLYRYHRLDALTEKELDELAKYARESLLSMPPSYRILIRESKETKELCNILVEEVIWEQDTASDSPPHTDSYIQSSYSYNDGENIYRQVDERIVWEWTNPGMEEEEKEALSPLGADVSFPYLLYGGYDSWKHWRESGFLRGFPDYRDFSGENADEMLWNSYKDIYSGERSLRMEESLSAPVYSPNGELLCYIELRAQNYPWRAAVDYLKYVYLLGFLLMLLCILWIIRAANKIYEQQAAMEEMRRDFVNAIAHELKTPLGIIRGFAENLQERSMEEKRDYYLEQIIGQTDEMDKLAARMIEMSKLDSEQLVLQREAVSMTELCREQMEKFAPVLEEKNLRVEYGGTADFLVEGDREYLAKAVWNLLSNAIAYNVPDGIVRVRTEKSGCSIENTGFPLSKENLAHACDMFYRGEDSRSGRKEHMGLGLFLASRILGLHHLKLRLENTEEGVRVIIGR